MTRPILCHDANGREVRAGDVVRCGCGARLCAGETVTAVAVSGAWLRTDRPYLMNVGNVVLVCHPLAGYRGPPLWGSR